MEKRLPRRVSLLLILFIAEAFMLQASVYETKQFRVPPMEFRPIPLWFWNNTAVNASDVEQQLEKMIATDGYGGCAILPFGKEFSPSYLSEDYFGLYRVAAEKARSMGAHMSVYDEYGFPSGSMGAINGSGVTTFKNNHPDHTVKRLDKTEILLEPGEVFDRQLSLSGKLMSLVAWNAETGQIKTLRPYYNESDRHLCWTAPEEKGWRVLVFECVVDGDPNVDYLSKEAVSLFVKDTHEAYYRHFDTYFGSTIVSTFFDEPTMYRAQGRMWTGDFNEQFESRYGFSPEELYPALWYDIGERTVWARNMLFGLHSVLYNEGFMQTIGDWAAKHGILATGHQDQEEIANPTGVAGDLMLVGKYLSMPGIDKIGGGRPTEDYYKVVSSSAHCWDKSYVMSETYGAMGNIPVEELYQVAIEQYTKGVNHLIPHAVWYNDKDVTFLPELSWRNPLYRNELPRFNRFLSRLNYLLARPGRHVADVAVVYPIQTLYAGHYMDGAKGFYLGGVDVPGTDYPLVSRLLTDELGLDFTYLHPEVLDDRCEVSDSLLCMKNEVNAESFRVIVLPGMSVISLSNLKKIEQAWESGVGVVFTTQVPRYCADAEGRDAEVKAIVERMLSRGGQHAPAIFVETPSAEKLDEALSALLPHPDVDFENETHPFNYMHKVIDGHDVYFFGNIDATSAECTIRLRQPLPKAMSLLDPHSGSDRPAQLTFGENRAELTLRLRPNQSVFLVDDNLLVKNAKAHEKTDVRKSYTIETRVNVRQLNAGVYFSSSDEQNYYMWQINLTDPDNPRLRPHRWMGGHAAVLAEINIPSEIGLRIGEPFDLRIEVEDESYATTYINNVLVDERGGSFSYGEVGFRQARDDSHGKVERACFDFLRVGVSTASGGKKVSAVSEKFSRRNLFSSGVLEDGWLCVEGEMSRDILARPLQEPSSRKLERHRVK